jgi:hypothetical protein
MLRPHPILSGTVGVAFGNAALFLRLLQRLNPPDCDIADPHVPFWPKADIGLCAAGLTSDASNVLV